MLLTIATTWYLILINKREDMDVNQHDRLSNLTPRHTFKYTNSAFIVVLYFTVTAWLKYFLFREEEEKVKCGVNIITYGNMFSMLFDITNIW